MTVVHRAGNAPYFRGAAEDLRETVHHPVAYFGMLAHAPLGEAAVHSVPCGNDLTRLLEGFAPGGGEDAEAVGLLQHVQDEDVVCVAPAVAAAVAGIVADIEWLVAGGRRRVAEVSMDVGVVIGAAQGEVGAQGGFHPRIHFPEVLGRGADGHEQQ